LLLSDSLTASGSFSGNVVGGTLRPDQIHSAHPLDLQFIFVAKEKHVSFTEVDPHA